MSDDEDNELPEHFNPEKYEGPRNQIKERHGRGKMQWPNGDIFEGDYRDGRREGFGKYTYAPKEEGGAVSFYEGEFKRNKKHGTGTFIYADGSKYVGEWKDDKRHGQGTYTFANGDMYTGMWAQGVKHGPGMYFSAANNSKFHGHWHHGEFRSGDWVANTDVYKGEFEQEKPVADGTYRFLNGNTQRGTYVKKELPLEEEEEADEEEEEKQPRRPQIESTWDGALVTEDVRDTKPWPPGLDNDETVNFMSNPFAFMQDKLERFGAVFRVKVLGDYAVGVVGPHALARPSLDTAVLRPSPTPHSQPAASSSAWSSFTRLGALPPPLQALFGDEAAMVAQEGQQHGAKKKVVMAAFAPAALELYLHTLNDMLPPFFEAIAASDGPVNLKHEFGRLCFELGASVFAGYHDEISRDLLREQHEVWSRGFKAPIKSAAFAAALQARDAMLTMFSHSVGAHLKKKNALWRKIVDQDPDADASAQATHEADSDAGRTSGASGRVAGKGASPMATGDEESMEAIAEVDEMLAEDQAYADDGHEGPAGRDDGAEADAWPPRPPRVPGQYDEQGKFIDDALTFLVEAVTKPEPPADLKTTADRDKFVAEAVGEALKREVLLMFASIEGPLKVLLVDTAMILAQHDHILNTVRDEVLRVSPTGPLTLDLLDQMRHLHALTMEVRRYFPIFALQYFRTAQDVTIAEYTVPKGWLVLSSIAAVHNDIALWTDPKKFDPARFEGDNSKEISPWTLLPHGGGETSSSHRCSGENVTTVLLKAVMVYLLREYEWTLEEEQVLDLDYTKIIPAPTSGVNVSIKKKEKEETEADD